MFKGDHTGYNSAPDVRLGDAFVMAEEECGCRICLESDNSDDLIAPCKCKGYSKWVHRECLNNWRTHEQDRAFSECTECQFYYLYEKQPAWNDSRRARFCLFVSRDLCLVTAAIHAVIAFLAVLVYYMAREFDWGSNLLCDHQNNSTSTHDGSEGFACRHGFITFYLLGFFGLLIAMGIFGSIFLCHNRCKLPDYGSKTVDRGISEPSPQDRSQFYSSRRRQHRDHNCCDTCLCVDPGGSDICCYPRYSYYGPQYYGTSGGGDCCCCPCDGLSHHTAGDGRHDCDIDGAHILLVILLVAAIIMAIIGLAVGVFVGVVVVQRIIQRHLFLLEKQRLAEEFQVADLSQYSDLEGLEVLPPPSFNVEDLEVLPPPQLPKSKLTTENEMHLRKIGLFE